MKVFTLLIALWIVTVCSSAKSQSTDTDGDREAQASTEPIKISREQASQSVVLLATNVNNDAPDKTNTGTGFLVNCNGHLLLVTASHVAKLTTSDTNVVYGDRDGIEQSLKFRELTGCADPPKWATHAIADVSAIYLKPSAELAKTFQERALPSAVLVGDLVAPDSEIPLTAFGFPMSLGRSVAAGQRRLSPLAKVFHAASGLNTIKLPGFANEVDIFFLDDPIAGGFSGSPLFALPGPFPKDGALVFSNRTAVLGLAAATVSDDTGGKMGVVVPCVHIVHALERALLDAKPTEGR